MLSRRGVILASQLDIPWRFVKSDERGRYHPDANPGGVISFATAENALIHDELEKFTRDNVQIPALAFAYRFSTAGGPRFPKALAVHLNEYFKPVVPLTGNEMIITSGATPLHEVLGWAFGEPGDGILTSVPAYGRFELDFGNKAGLTMVYARTDSETSFLPGVVDEFERTLTRAHERGTRIAALLIVNPNNPLGKCYPRETLEALVRFCGRHHLHLISDEVYGLSVFDSGEAGAVPFTSVLALDVPPEYRDLVHVTYGFSKDFGSAGVRLGALITRNKQLLAASLAMVRFHSPSGMSIAVATAMLEDRAWCRAFIDTSRSRLAKAYCMITSELQRMGISYVKGTNACFFVFVDLSNYLPPASEGLSQLDREIALAARAFENGVFIQPGEEHAVTPGWFRLVYASDDEETVKEGLRRLEKTLSSISW